MWLFGGPSSASALRVPASPRSCAGSWETQRTLPTLSSSSRRTAYTYTPDPQLYAPSSAASYFEAPGGAQVTMAGSSPPTVPSHSMVGIAMDVGGSPIVSGAGAYLIHGGMDSTKHSLAHSSRSSPATVCARTHGARHLVYGSRVRGRLSASESPQKTLLQLGQWAPGSRHTQEEHLCTSFRPREGRGWEGAPWRRHDKSGRCYWARKRICTSHRGSACGCEMRCKEMSEEDWGR